MSTRADRVFDGWAEMYVSGRWSLGEFEAHVEECLPAIPPEWYAPDPPRRSKGRPSAKEAAERWSASAARSAANYSMGVSAFAFADAATHNRGGNE